MAEASWSCRFFTCTPAIPTPENFECSREACVNDGERVVFTERRLKPHNLPTAPAPSARHDGDAVLADTVLRLHSQESSSTRLWGFHAHEPAGSIVGL